MPASPREGVDLARESVAGEEDPGACDELSPAASAPQAPGDEAPAGTPGTGEAVCPRCGGSGSSDGDACPECGGSGRIVQGIGGA